MSTAERIQELLHDAVNLCETLIDEASDNDQLAVAKDISDATGNALSVVTLYLVTRDTP